MRLTMLTCVKRWYEIVHNFVTWTRSKLLSRWPFIRREEHLCKGAGDAQPVNVNLKIHFYILKNTFWCSTYNSMCVFAQKLQAWAVQA